MTANPEAQQILADAVASFEAMSYEELRDLCLDHERSTEITSTRGKRYSLEVLAYWDDKPLGPLRVFVNLTSDGWRPYVSIHDDFIKSAQPRAEPSGINERAGPNWPWLPYFEFESADKGYLILLDAAGYIHQEPPEFEEFGPDLIFDSSGRRAELAIDGFDVVVKGWPDQPDLDHFDRCLRTAAVAYMKDEDVSSLATLELRDRLEKAVRKWHRERSLFMPIRRLARKVSDRLSRRSPDSSGEGC
jgi:hypothetical protein